MSDIVNEFSISIEQLQDFEFLVRFDKEPHGTMHMDEPPPLGKDNAPSSARMLAAAVGHCLSASLLFCTRRKGAKMDGMRADVKVRIVKTESRRLRIGGIDVVLDAKMDPAEAAKALECLNTFEDFCTVTASVRAGIPVNVSVKGVAS
jgi:uncharacterized OsmC-like protein